MIALVLIAGVWFLSRRRRSGRHGHRLLLVVAVVGVALLLGFRPKARWS